MLLNVCLPFKKIMLENKNSKRQSYLQVVVLSLLLGLQVQPGESTKVLLANGFVHSGTAAYSLAIVMCGVRPPVRLHFHVSENHVLNWSREAGYLIEICYPYDAI